MKAWIVFLLVLAAAVTGLVVSLAAGGGSRDWPRELADPDPAVRAQAVRDMPLEGNVDLLIQALRDEDADIRMLAADRQEVNVAYKAEERARALVQALKDKHAGVRRQAVWALAWIAPDAWPALRDGLADPDPRVRAGAADAIYGSLESKRSSHWSQGQLRDMAEALAKLQKDDNVEVVKSASGALRALNEALSPGTR
jgi:HEAT repeat protein